MDSLVYFFGIVGAVMLADDHAGTTGKAGKQADEDVDDDTHASHGGIGLVGGVIAHYVGVHQIVHLLEQIAQHQGEGKGQQVTGDIALGHVHILAAKGSGMHIEAPF